MLGGRVGAGRSERDRPGDGHEVDDVGLPARGDGGLEAGEERAGTPHRAEVVDLHHLLDPLCVDGEEGASRRDARVVDEQVHRRVSLEDARGGSLDGRAVGDVADLGLAPDLVGERAQPILAARDEHAAPSLFREEAGGRLADPGRRPRHHCHTAVRAGVGVGRLTHARPH